MANIRLNIMELTYTSYIKVDELLELQEPKSSPVEHDEILFIIIHQTYELWFKQILHEIDYARSLLSNADLYATIATFKRLRTIMKTLVGQMDILETMTPRSFSSFRDRLESASGFQSVQYRELEFILGYKRPETLQFYNHDPAGKARLEKRLVERSLFDHFCEFLANQGFSIPAALISDSTKATEADHQKLQATLIEIYKARPDLQMLQELMTDFDEGLQEWRYRHVMLVQRTIGNKQGTGGSLGVEFLKRALFKPAFPDLWEIRHAF